MKFARRMAVLALLSSVGCFPSHPAAPEEEALERYGEAEAHFAAGRYLEAAEGYESVVQRRPRWKDAYLKLARCREATGRSEEAANVFERLLAGDRFDEDALRALGRLYAALGSTDRAIDCYRRLRELHPGDRSLDGEIARLEAMRKP
jgi:tetratricopeptide (TPR) repeat protein